VEKDGSRKFPVHCIECAGKEKDPGKTAYPAVFCEKCEALFPFKTETFNEGDMPEKCPLCGNTDKKTLFLFLNVDQIYENEFGEDFNMPSEEEYRFYENMREGEGDPGKEGIPDPVR
jgi:hypothetical protein